MRFKESELSNHSEGYSPLYNIVPGSKFEILYQATKIGPFDTKNFYWIDAG
jgi:hypothetical protein